MKKKEFLVFWYLGLLGISFWAFSGGIIFANRVGSTVAGLLCWFGVVMVLTVSLVYGKKFRALLNSLEK